jgi:hypothetical protein
MSKFNVFMREESSKSTERTFIMGYNEITFITGPKLISKLGCDETQHMIFFYIYFITILKKYMIWHKFCKNIHLAPWPMASGT